MLTFDEKLTIIESFEQLTRNDISLGRVNFHYEDSVLDKQIVVYRLHPNGNGFVYTGSSPKTFSADAKGMTNIRDFTTEELRAILIESIHSLSKQDPIEETWKDEEGHTLLLFSEGETWDIYSGDLLDGTYTTKSGALNYLEQEGFKRKYY